MNKSRISIFSVVLHLLPAFLLCAMFAAVGIMHVSSRVLVVRVGYALSDLQSESRALTRENDRLKLELATLKTPTRLEKAAREDLGMAPPNAAQVISLAPAISSSTKPSTDAAPKQARADIASQRMGRRGAP